MNENCDDVFLKKEQTISWDNAPEWVLQGIIGREELSSPYDLFGKDIPITEDELSSLQLSCKPSPNIKPYVKFLDMNNTPGDVNYNKPKSTVQIGIKITF